jgi:hypothetical protein
MRIIVLPFLATMEFLPAGEKPLALSGSTLHLPPRQSRSEKRAERMAYIAAMKPNECFHANWVVRQSGSRGPLVLQLT